MKIIRHGKNFKLKEKRILKCNNCHCVFIATKEEVHIEENCFNEPTYFVDCPDCNWSIFYQKKV